MSIDLLITEPNGDTHLFRCPVRVVVLQKRACGHKALFEISEDGRIGEPRTCLEFADDYNKKPIGW